MTKVTQTGSVVTTLVYDGDGLRRKKQTASDTTKFIWDKQDVLIETNDAGTTQVNYTQTPDMYGSLVSQRRSGTSKFYFYDALGSTSELADSSQTQTDSYRYYAFGISLASSGSTVNPYQYVGKLGYYNEPDIDLQYLRARWYDPNMGRFISKDPIQNGSNWYAYVDGNPVIFDDPNGLRPAFVMNYSCKKLLGEKNAEIIRADLDNHIDSIYEKWPGSDMQDCNITISIECIKNAISRNKDGIVCGRKGRGMKFSKPGTIEISLAPECKGPKCLILHEAIHVCNPGLGSYGCWPEIKIPGCGNISGQHTQK